MKSYLSHLECTYCHETYSSGELHRTCDDCGKVLYPRYDLEAARSGFDRGVLRDRLPNMWRYFEMMPVLDEANVVTLGEGYTPIFKAERLGKDMGCSALYIKDEGLNPTASFKARGLSAAVSKAKELGVTRLTMPSAGNAAGAMTSYAAKAGMEAHIFMPRDAPAANQKEVVITGGKLTLVDGIITDAGRISGEKAEELGLFDISTLREPYRVEGKKTMGYEIAEQSGWTLPDVILYPTGGGTGIVGMWKAFEEMEALGWIGSGRPKMFAIQSEGCAPIVKAFREGAEFAEMWPNASTLAAGIRVPAAIAASARIFITRRKPARFLSCSETDSATSVASPSGCLISTTFRLILRSIRSSSASFSRSTSAPLGPMTRPGRAVWMNTLTSSRVRSISTRATAA